MVLEASAREANVRDSVKKFFVDNVPTSSGIALSFDKGMATPRLQGQPIAITRWVSVNFGYMDFGTLSDIQLRVFCCTRQDNEGFRLAQLRDTVMGYLTDIDQTDGMCRIDFYRSYQNQAWELIGALLVQDVSESGQFEADDETKYKILNVRLRVASRI